MSGKGQSKLKLSGNGNECKPLLSGFNVANRYLIVLYYNPNRVSKKADQRAKAAEIKMLQEKHGVDGTSDKL